jgi:cytidine deaminase
MSDAPVHDRDLVGLGELERADRELVEAAMRARELAHAPFSGFLVGAAVRLDDGTIVPGCNIEISSYGLTVCAERVSLFAARSRTRRPVRAIAVVGPGHEGVPTPPCGACRQVIWDLAGDVTVLLATPDGLVERWTAGELMPAPFGPEQLSSPVEDGEQLLIPGVAPDEPETADALGDER